MKTFFRRFVFCVAVGDLVVGGLLLAGAILGHGSMRVWSGAAILLVVGLLCLRMTTRMRTGEFWRPFDHA